MPARKELPESAIYFYRRGNIAGLCRICHGFILHAEPVVYDQPPLVAHKSCYDRERGAS